jgi:hypothetical protein
MHGSESWVTVKVLQGVLIRIPGYPRSQHSADRMMSTRHKDHCENLDCRIAEDHRPVPDQGGRQSQANRVMKKPVSGRSRRR